MENQLLVTFNNENYIATYNEQTGYYELELTAPSTGGIYTAEIEFTDLYLQTYEDSVDIQVWAKQPVVIETNKVFMWIFDHKDFSVKDIVEISDYEISIDEETNSNSLISVLKKTTAKSEDIVAIKKNNEVIYWGIIDNIQNNDGEALYQYTLKYITNLFNQSVILENESLIKTAGIEDFIEDAINSNFINNIDTFVNLNYLEINVKTHTKKQTTVSNVQNNIYNLHTWITNCTQLYNIVYSFEIVNRKLVMTIEEKELETELIDINAQPISNYTEIFETDVVSKVTVLYDRVNEAENPGQYVLYLLNDRTTTTNINDTNRAEGKSATVYTANYEDAQQMALDQMKANAYNHNITFAYYNRFIQIGTPIAIKTKESLIYDTYISAIKITQNKFIEYTCGNIRINFIDKLLKERSK